MKRKRGHSQLVEGWVQGCRGHVDVCQAGRRPELKETIKIRLSRQRTGKSIMKINDHFDFPSLIPSSSSQLAWLSL